MTSAYLDYLWQPRPLCANTRLRRWLQDRKSLTRRIEARCSRFNLEVLKQASCTIGRDERALLGTRRTEKCLVREVSLNCGRNPVVFAHSVVASGALRGAWHWLNNLGTQPLGAVLFADPQIKRFPLHFCQLTVNHELYRRAAALIEEPPSRLWARRSIFELRRSRLIVTEVFLPDILGLPP